MFFARDRFLRANPALAALLMFVVIAAVTGVGWRWRPTLWPVRSGWPG